MLRVRSAFLLQFLRDMAKRLFRDPLSAFRKGKH